MPKGVWKTGNTDRGRKPLAPMYVTPNVGINVVSEHIKIGSGGIRRRYCCIRPHPMIRGICIQKSRVVMTDHLGRALGRNEHVHHGAQGTTVDTINNLELLTAADHNRHHKTGSKHTAKSKAQTSATLKHLYKTGQKVPKPAYGVKNTSAKLNPAKVRKIRRLYAANILGQHKLATMFGVSKPTIRSVINRTTWGHVK